MSNFPSKPDPILAEDTQPLWRDSSLELVGGLDVVELHVDVALPLEPEDGTKPTDPVKDAKAWSVELDKKN